MSNAFPIAVRLEDALKPGVKAARTRAAAEALVPDQTIEFKGMLNQEITRTIHSPFAHGNYSFQGELERGSALVVLLLPKHLNFLENG